MSWEIFASFLAPACTISQLSKQVLEISENLFWKLCCQHGSSPLETPVVSLSGCCLHHITFQQILLKSRQNICIPGIAIFNRNDDSNHYRTCYLLYSKLHVSDTWQWHEDISRGNTASCKLSSQSSCSELRRFICEGIQGYSKPPTAHRGQEQREGEELISPLS